MAVVRVILPFVLPHVGFVLEANVVVAFTAVSPEIVQVFAVMSVVLAVAPVGLYFMPVAPRSRPVGQVGFVAQPCKVAE